jgi:hypothetical protein
MASNGNSNGVDTPSENLLYHIRCEVIDYHKDPSGLTRDNIIYGTYTTLPSAKASALTSLKTAGYEPDDFTIYAEKTDPETWSYGDGVLVYAKAPNGNELRVRIDVTENNIARQLTVNKESGEVEEDLYYVLQTQIDYYDDRIGGKQESIIEGAYLDRKKAEEAAYNVLLDEPDGVTSESYAEYDRLDEQKDDWPYGDDVLVHAVGRDGKNFKVEVKTRTKIQHKR